jgi:hypothetical protein
MVKTIPAILLMMAVASAGLATFQPHDGEWKLTGTGEWTAGPGNARITVTFWVSDEGRLMKVEPKKASNGNKANRGS